MTSAAARLWLRLVARPLHAGLCNALEPFVDRRGRLLAEAFELGTRCANLGDACRMVSGQSERLAMKQATGYAPVVRDAFRRLDLCGRLHGGGELADLDLTVGERDEDAGEMVHVAELAEHRCRRVEEGDCVVAMVHLR